MSAIPSFKPDEFTFIKEIGHGTFASVTLQKKNDTGELFAIKEYDGQTNNVSEMYEANFLQEIAILAQCDHPCIVKFHGFIEHEAGKDLKLAYITEYLEDGSLDLLLEKLFLGSDLTIFGPTEKTLAAAGIASAMNFLHNKANKSAPLVHRDLKSSNVLLDKNLHVKIADFGSAKILRNDYRNTQQVGSFPWMAPEVMTSEAYGPEADVFSYAMILYELLTNHMPNCDYLNIAEFFQKVGLEGERPFVPENDKKIGDLMTKCWSQNPDDRPSFEIIMNGFVKGEYFFDNTDMKKLDSYLHEIGEK